jgi:hypothetical protein
MKSFVVIALAVVAVLAGTVACGFQAHGQIKTKETRVTVDSLKGDTTITKSETISESEDITPRSSMIVINPLKFFVFYNISYFHRVSPSVVVGGGIQFPTPSEWSGFGLLAEVRIHPSKKALRGFYFAPNISYNHLEEGGEETSPFSVGALVGWQWFPGDEFAMGLGIGADYYIGSVTSTGGGDSQDYNGWMPLVRFDIGYAW